MKLLMKTVVAAMICGCCLLAHPLSAGDDVVKNEKLPDMSTSDNPVVLKGIKDIDSIRYKQEDYIKENYKGYEIQTLHSYTMRGDRYIQIISIENEAKDKKRIYFDMTNVYKKLSASKDRKVRERVKTMMDWHTPLDPNKTPKDSDSPFL